MTVVDINSIATKSIKNIRFAKESVRVEKINQKTGEIIVKDYIIIVLRNMDTGVIVPHPISEFLNKWKNKSYSVKMRRATEIVPFLNYILIDNAKKYGINSLWDITFEHGEDFLNDKSLEVTRKTILQYESTLTEFYFFLTKKKLLHTISIDDFELIERRQGARVITTCLSPFQNVDYPSRGRNQNILHHLPNELIIPFIDTAIRKTPRIAFGVYLQFFGGLRIGEVTNLTRESITSKGAFGENGLVANIEKRDLRPDLFDNRGKGEPKKPRYQVVIPIKGLTVELFQNHLKQYKPCKETGALFVNKDGLALTADSYRYYFSKLKAAFIERLRVSNNLTLNTYALTLKTKKWNSHLGRGVFSNMVADVADNALEIALSRGDSSLESALSYLSDSSKISKAVEENIASMYTEMLV